METFLHLYVKRSANIAGIELIRSRPSRTSICDGLDVGVGQMPFGRFRRHQDSPDRRTQYAINVLGREMQLAQERNIVRIRLTGAETTVQGGLKIRD